MAEPRLDRPGLAWGLVLSACTVPAWWYATGHPLDGRTLTLIVAPLVLCVLGALALLFRRRS